MGRQHYISDELTHLVGGHRDVQLEGQYLRLLRILSYCRLTYDPEKPRGGALICGIAIDPAARIRANEMVIPRMVCFCDIPVDDLGVHIQKYGYFGLSFSKEFVASKGGAPVYYVPEKTKSASFDEGFRQMWTLLVGENGPGDEKNRELVTFLLKSFFGFLKCFDHTLPEDHPENYYFEREWRILGELEFVLEDIRRIFLPKCYAERFRNDCPDYSGELCYTKEGFEDEGLIKHTIRCQNCGFEKKVQIPAETYVSCGIVFDKRGNTRDTLICVECGKSDVDSVP